MLKRLTVTVSLLLVCLVMQCRADDQPVVLDATFTCRNPEARYGQNIQFDISFTNNSTSPVQFIKLHFSKYSPPLWIKPMPDGAWERFKRFSASGSGGRMETMTLAPGQSIKGSILLYYEPTEAGQLMPGKYLARLGSPPKDKSEKKRRGIYDELDEIALTIVTNQQVQTDYDEWVALCKEMLEKNHDGGSIFDWHRKTINQFQTYLKTHPNCPWAVDIEMFIAETLWELRQDIPRDSDEQLKLGRDNCDHLFGIARSPDALPYQKELALESIYKKWGDEYKDPLTSFRSLKMLKQINPDNAFLLEKIKGLQEGNAKWNVQEAAENYIRFYSTDYQLERAIDSFEIRFELLADYPQVIEILTAVRNILQAELNKRKATVKPE